jgi:outer membrane murein-binding lipoprotein Lpp
VLIQAATLVFFIYGAIQIKQQAAQLQQTVNTKVDKFSNNTQGISQDLNAIKKELGQQKTRFGF